MSRLESFESRRNLYGVEFGREEPDEFEREAFQIPKSRLSCFYRQIYSRCSPEQGNGKISPPIETEEWNSGDDLN